MSLEQSYCSLASLLDYPQGKESLLLNYRSVADYLSRNGIESPAAPFAELLRSSTLSELQEDYVAQFDFNQTVAPYLGHHLYGDNQKKGSYMIKVKQEYLRHRFEAAENELPDHLSVLLAFLAHLARLGEDAVRRQFISELVLPGINKLVAGCSPSKSSPWFGLFEAAGALCTVDCREVSAC